MGTISQGHCNEVKYSNRFNTQKDTALVAGLGWASVSQKNNKSCTWEVNGGLLKE